MAAAAAPKSGNLAQIAGNIKLDTMKFLHPDTCLAECTRVLTQLGRYSKQFPLINMNGKASDTSYTLVLDDAQRRNMPSFPNIATASGRDQHKHDNEQIFLLLQAIFGEAWTIITEDDFLDQSSYASVDCPYHVRDAHGNILERFPIAVVAINKLLEHCKEDANVVNEILRAKITSYAAPVSSSNDDIVRHNSQLQELQDLWNANKIHPHVLNTELTRIHQLVMTLKKVNKSDNPLQFPYETFLSTHRTETSLTKFLESLKTFIQAEIRNDQSFASATSTKPTDPRKRKISDLQVTANATLPGTRGTCPMHPNANHTAEECNALRRLAKEIHDPGARDQSKAPAGNDYKKSRYNNNRGPKTFHQPKASEPQKLHDPTGKYQGKNFDIKKWQAHHATPTSDSKTTEQDHQLAQALQAAIGPRVHFDSDQVHALCVVPQVTDSTDGPPIILETDSDAEDAEIMQEKANDAKDDVDDNDTMQDDVDADQWRYNYDADDMELQKFCELTDHYDLPEELQAKIEDFNDYVSTFATKKGDTTSEEYLLTRHLLLAGIHAHMQVWQATNPKTRFAKEEEEVFGNSSDEDDSDDEFENSNDPVDTDPDESPRATSKV